MTSRSRLALLPPALALAALLAVAVAPCGAATPSPLLGVDPLGAGTVVEHHPEAVPHWVAAGRSGAVLLHVDAAHGLGPLDPKNLAALRALAGSGGLQARSVGDRGERLFREANFVRAAIGIGIVRELVWVAPFPLRLDAEGEELLRGYLRSTGLTEEEARTFHAAEGSHRGSVGGVPVIVCAREGLPALREPVIVSIGADYFPSAADFRGTTPLGEVRALFTALRAVRYPVLETVVAFSVQAGEVPPHLRWVGDAVLEVLKDPALALPGKPPPRWRILQRLSAPAVPAAPGKETEAEAALLGTVLAELELQPHDPALLLYAAEAAVRHGRGGGRARSYAEEACRIDRGYCAGLPEVGLRLVAAGDVEEGLRCFAVAEELLPGMPYGQLDLGIALMKAGRAAEALAALEKVRARDGAFPSGFLIGAVHLFQDDRAAARLAFDAALAALEGAADASVERGEIAQVIETAAAFYREEGREQEAGRLEGDPRLRLRAPP